MERRASYNARERKDKEEKTEINRTENLWSLSQKKENHELYFALYCRKIYDTLFFLYSSLGNLPRKRNNTKHSSIQPRRTVTNNGCINVWNLRSRVRQTYISRAINVNLKRKIVLLVLLPPVWRNSHCFSLSLKWRRWHVINWRSCVQLRHRQPVTRPSGQAKTRQTIKETKR